MNSYPGGWVTWPGCSHGEGMAGDLRAWLVVAGNVSTVAVVQPKARNLIVVGYTVHACLPLWDSTV